MLDIFDPERTIGTINNPYKNKDGSVEIGFDNFPHIIPKFLKTTEEKSFFEHIRGASARRRFYLQRDWKLSIKIDKDKYSQFNNKDFLDDYIKLNGILVIPCVVEDSKTIFDGASIPFPWLVSFISFGILRPLGVMLTASIVHDFAYEYGYLNDGSMNKIKIRHTIQIRLNVKISKDSKQKSKNKRLKQNPLADIAGKLGGKFWLETQSEIPGLFHSKDCQNLL